MTQLAEHQRQVLIRCQVENRKKNRSVRYVEKNHYQLWQYMVTNKHELRVRNAALCLWMSTLEFEQQHQLFSQSGEVESVNQIRFAIFDQRTGMCDTLQRFVALADADTVSDLLLQRIPKDLRESNDFAMQMDTGIAVIQKDQVDISQLGLVVKR